MRTRSVLVVACALLCWLPAAMACGAEPSLNELLGRLKAVGPEAAGHEQAAAAWPKLAELGAEQLVPILAGMDGASPLAANWIALAAEAVAERHAAGGGKLPVGQLEQFVLDRGHSSRGRRLAYEMLRSADPQAEARLLPGMLDDPARELRRDAVDRLIAAAARAATEGRNEAAAATYQQALQAVWELDQATLVADRLRDLGQPADLARQLGIITAWRLIGPFDNTARHGFDTAYPPETAIDFAAVYPGKQGEVRWQEFTSQDRLGRVDLFQPLGRQREVVGYAATEFFADEPREAEIRMSSSNASKLWLNGRLVNVRPVYHSGTDFDQFVDRVTLKAGRNLILVKLCQNEQTEEWAQRWDFQLRVCDVNGAALHSLEPAKE